MLAVMEIECTVSDFSTFRTFEACGASVKKAGSFGIFSRFRKKSPLLN